MCYQKITSLAIILSFAFVAALSAQEEAPRKLRRPLEVLSLDVDAGAVAATGAETEDEHVANASTKLPHVDDQGRVRGGNVADRVRSMRRRAVDVNLSRSFFTRYANAAALPTKELSR